MRSSDDPSTVPLERAHAGSGRDVLGLRELQLDGLVGPTHNYGGLSRGNTASESHGGETSNPRAAAHEGLAKMRLVRSLGVLQGVLPPHDRPSLRALRQLGFRGSDEQMLAAAAAERGGLYLRLTSSAAAMWAANAATVTPSGDTADGRVHLTPANLQQMFHRSIEPPVTVRALRAIFADPARFIVHEPLPGGGQFADEGAANHTRLSTSRGAVHLYAWGRATWSAVPYDGGSAREGAPGPKRHPARQTREASEAIARSHGVDPARCVFAQQAPAGIDAGAFHTDVLAVGCERLLLMHELAFADEHAVRAMLGERLGDELVIVRASNAELPVARAVAAYAFNSQVLATGEGFVVVAAEDAREDEPSRAFFDRLLAGAAPVRAVHYVDVRQSMRNGGGPACLRLRVPLTVDEERALSGHVVVDEALDVALSAWVDRHYRDRLAAADLADPALAREGMRALDELTALLGLGALYDFQRAAGGEAAGVVLDA